MHTMGVGEELDEEEVEVVVVVVVRVLFEDPPFTQ